MTTTSEGSQASPPRGALRAALPLYVLPIAIFGGLFLAVEYAPDGVEDFYVEKALPFLIAVWIGAGFTFTWGVVRESMLRDKAPPWMMAAVGLLSALVLLSMLDGWTLLWEDPWLFGVAVSPGFAMARPLIERWLGGRALVAGVPVGGSAGPPE